MKIQFIDLRGFEGAHEGSRADYFPVFSLGTLLLTLRGVEADLTFPPSCPLLHTVYGSLTHPPFVESLFTEAYFT